MRFETCYAPEGMNVKQGKEDEGFANLLLSFFFVEEVTSTQHRCDFLDERRQTSPLLMS